MKPLFLINILIFLLAVSCTNAQKESKNIPVRIFPSNPSLFKNHLGINAFEWDFSDSDNGLIPESRKKVIRSFGGFRHYMDWDKLESEEGKYTFNPVHSGGWNYDMIYQWCKSENIEVLADLKSCPSWLVNTYPKDQRNAENVPAPYGLNRKLPSSYLKQAKVAFQFAARYGHNKAVPRALVSVNTNARWPGDQLNYVRVGLGYVKYIECDNERDKTWKGPQAHQNAEEYAANMSAFYDGHMGKLGKNAGVKTADPSMKVVMGGLSDPDIKYVIKMIEWCKKNRGYKADGSVNLCFDVINYHAYNNDWTGSADPTVGKPPELSRAAALADAFVAMARKHANGTEVWNTESGYDINTKSPQRAIAIGKKPALITQADWMLRSALLYARHGIKRSFFYMLDDVDPNSTTQYGTSGFAVGSKRRPVADYFFQVKKLMGDFHFVKNMKTDPIVDVYGLNGRKIFVMFVPDEQDRRTAFRLNMGTASSVTVYTPVAGADSMRAKIVATPKGILNIMLTETPVFVEKN
ncbi:hypothetical protein SAMN06265348_11454 [Pedobacter westerhofensis]|uniref:Beta-galactosidase n=1 Tax=Pedobacter westerhofensis TaxID=425512 RepID=A0A521FPE9_9SPHI|nr:hypothetical protein [Pedobacter westerhofensis]SMO97440.1 hypothetical protein SAMN06265348_11454 [Pedobacter westerhofensis]